MPPEIKPQVPKDNPGLTVVGQRQPRLDGADKVSGRSVFTDDVVLPGMPVVASSYTRRRYTLIHSPCRLDESRTPPPKPTKCSILG